MKRKNKLYISDILDNMRLAQELVNDIDFEGFVNDRRTNYAVIRCIEVIGEAVKHVPENIREQYTQIPWKEMAGMRDKVIHFYMGIDFEIVWRVVVEKFKDIQPQIEQVFKEIKD